MEFITTCNVTVCVTYWDVMVNVEVCMCAECHACNSVDVCVGHLVIPNTNKSEVIPPSLNFRVKSLYRITRLENEIHLE